MQQYNVRFYETKDRESCLKMAEDYCTSHGHTLNRESFEPYLDGLENTGAILVAADKDDNAVGAISLIHIQNTLTGKRLLHKADLFVVEEHRNNGLGKSLLAKAEELGDLVGIQEYSWKWERST